MNRITTILITLGLVLFVIIPSCKKDARPDNQSILSNHHDEGRLESMKTLLVKNLAASLGSTIGPGGDLFVPDPVAGSILCIDPKTGDYTTFASGLPKLIPAVGLGGVTDVTFIDGKAYALVTVVDDPNLFPTGQVNGIYRIDGPNNFTIIANIGAFNVAHPPTGFDFFVSTGLSYAIQNYRGGFLVTDGHLNRVLYVTLEGNITILRQFNDIVPTGLAVSGSLVYMCEAGPVPHLPENGKVVSFSSNSPTVTTVASGAPLVVDVERGRGQELFALSQGTFGGGDPGSPALPNTGSLVKVNTDGTFSVIADKLDRPTSFEIVKNTAYIVTLAGEIWTVDDIAGPPFGRAHQKHLLHGHN